jgi:hypothetical protein
VLLGVAIGVHADDPFGDPSYQKMSRTQKANKLWATIANNTQSLDYYGLFDQSQLFLESMDLSFDTKADDMPKNIFGTFLERKKLIHTVGAVARASITITSNPMKYTGLLSSGCDASLLRFSLAVKPDSKNAPGVAIKCLRDGVPSGNFFFMYALDGQETFNFFEHDLTNHVPAPSESWVTTPIAALALKFATASEWPSMIGLSNVARWDQNGFNSTRPNFPYRLVIHPNSQVRSSFPSTDTGKPVVLELMNRLSSSTRLYDIYAQDSPLQPNGKLFKIGYIELQSRPTTSFFGDRHYFHQHTFFEDDLAQKSQWYDDAQEDVSRQEDPSGARFRYGDLPF